MEKRKYLTFLVGFLFVVPSALASSGAGVTYHGRLLKPNGEPVTEASVRFKIQIRTPGNENCLMYEETHVKNMAASNGVFAIGINDGSAAVFNTEPFTLSRVFQNRGTFEFGVGKCSGDSTYTPNPSDGRIIVVEFNDGTFAGFESLPSQSINFVPMSIESMTVGGFNAGSLLRVLNPAGAPAAVDPLSTSQHTSLMNLIAGTSSAYLTPTSPLSGANLTPGSVSDAKLATGISGAKISGDIPGHAAGFTGSLAGDVTGAQGATSVVRLQGRNIDTAPPSHGQVLKWNHPSSRWEPSADLNDGAIASMTGTLPISVTAGANPVISVGDASTTAKGVVRLATNGDNSSADQAVAANDSRLSDTRVPKAHTHFASDVASASGVYLTYRPNGIACADGEVLKWNSTDSRWICGVDAAGGGGGGTVTSVNVSVPSYMTSTGGAVTSSGTIALDFANQAQHLVFAGPTVPSAGAPSFRLLRISDLRNAAGTGGFLNQTGACANAGEALGHNSVNDTLECQPVVTSAAVAAALGYSPVNPTALANYLPLSGGAMAGALNMGGFQITGVSNIPFVATNPSASEDGQSLRWNQTAGQWEWFTAGAAGGGNELTALTGDVTAAGPGSSVATISVGAVTSAKILDGTVATVDIANGAVTDAKIVDVGVGKITNGAGQYFKYAPNNINCSDTQVLKWNGSQSRWECGADLSGGVGTVTSVTAGTGLTGGTITSAGTFHVDVGTGNNQIVQLDGTAKLPAVNGSLLTALNASNIATGTLDVGRLPSSVTDALWGASSGNVYRTSGKVGVGTNAPATLLEIAGTVKVADGGETCSTGAHGGMIRYSGGSLQFCNGSSWQTLGLSGAGLTSLGAQTGDTQTFAAGTDGTAPAIASSANVHTLNVPLAATAGVISGTISKAQYDSFAAKVDSARSITAGTGLTGGGDLSTNRTLAVNVGTGANQIPQLDAGGKIQAAVLPSTVVRSSIAPSNDQVLVYKTGTSSWEPRHFGIDDLRTELGTAQFASAACTASQTLTWSAITDAFTCSDIVIGSSNITSGSVTLASLASGLAEQMWSAASGNLYRLAGSVGIGTAAPEASAILELSSTSKGFLPPRMSTSQRNAIASPVAGLVVYNTSVGSLQYFDGVSWKALSTGSGAGGSSPAYTLKQCAVGYTYALGSCYKYIATAKNFATARLDCQAEGGDLANIGSAEENAAAYELVPTGVTAWIGFGDSVTEGYFLWADTNSPFPSYRNWGASQPDNASNEDCVQFMSPSGAWNDATCTSTSPSVCEMAPADPELPVYGSCKEILDAGGSTGDGVYMIDPDGQKGPLSPTHAYCDMTTDGGGWTLLMNYNHLGGTNPALNVRTTSFPLLGSTTLGVNESGTLYWGQAAIALRGKIIPTEMRYYCRTSGHARVVHFKTNNDRAIYHALTGNNSSAGIATSFTPLSGHTGNLPGSATSSDAGLGENVMGGHQFYQSTAAHFLVRNGTRWECDDYPNNSANSTHHQAWSR